MADYGGLGCRAAAEEILLRHFAGRAPDLAGAIADAIQNAYLVGKAGGGRVPPDEEAAPAVSRGAGDVSG